MPFQGWMRLGGSCAVVLAVVAGCRGTRMPVLDRTPAGIVYDTAHEADLRSGKIPALAAEAWGRYVDTLAELLGAPKPRRIPRTAVRLALGKSAILLTSSQRVSNRAFKETTGWTPRHPSVIDGWRQVLAGAR